MRAALLSCLLVTIAFGLDASGQREEAVGAFDFSQITGFDRSKMNHVETVEKNSLPTDVRLEDIDSVEDSVGGLRCVKSGRTCRPGPQLPCCRGFVCRQSEDLLSNLCVPGDEEEEDVVDRNCWDNDGTVTTDWGYDSCADFLKEVPEVCEKFAIVASTCCKSCKALAKKASEESIGHGRHGHHGQHGKGGHYGHHGYHHSGYGGGYGGNGNQQSGVCADNISWSDSWGSCATWKHSGWCANCQNGPNWKNWWHGSFRQTGAFHNCKASCGCCTPEPATPVVTPPAPVVRAAATHKNRAASEASVGTSSSGSSTNAFGIVALCGVFGAVGYAAGHFLQKKKDNTYEQMNDVELF